jgi:putative NADPH-quinone reductase
MKVVAVVGTYRKERTIDTAVDEALRGAAQAGAVTEKIQLLDKHIEFCTNCRTCTQTPGPVRGRCVLNDDMESILDTLEQADAYIFASPVNFFSVTALMKRFIERLICYGDWPWGKAFPKMRLKKGPKKALLITSSACPAFIGRIMFRSVFKVLSACADCLGAGSVQKLYFGMVARYPDDTLSEKNQGSAYAAGQKLAH